MYIYDIAAMCNFAAGLAYCTQDASGVKIESYESYKIIIAGGSK